MLKITNLSKSFGTHILFDEANFTINPGERIGLVGRNGHGKTTLLKILTKQDYPDAGEIHIPKHYRIGYLEQHLEFTQKTLVEEGCLGLPENKKDEQWLVEKTLFGLGFSKEDLQKSPQDFSGGFQIRLNLAKLLVSEPNLLLLDEPTNYLDIVSIRWLISFLRSWPDEILLITHDRSFMDQVVTHIVGIHREKIRKMEGSTEKYYEQIAQEEEIHEKTRLNEEKKRKKTEVFISKFRAKARQAGLVQSRIKMLEKQNTLDKLDEIASLNFSFTTDPLHAKVLLQGTNLAFSYHEKPPYLFEKLTFTVHKHDRICIIGKNGKGKSTLLKILSQDLKPQQGTIKTHPSVKIGYFGQTNIQRLDKHKTVYEEILSSDSKCTPQRAYDIAGLMMFEDELTRKKISVLSGGEKSRVLLGKLLVAPSHLLLLDEPTSHLDMESCDALIDAIQRFDGAVLLVTHDEAILREVANRFIIFKNDQVFQFEGTYQQFLSEIGWENDIIPDANRNQSKQPTLSKKELRQQKAAKQLKHTQHLKPIQEKIKKIENQIETLEQESHTITEELVIASQNQDTGTIIKHGKRNREILESLTFFYDELDVVTKLYEKEKEKLSAES
ncbi:MAG: ABC-F family ATP-binding cassette domain-containing protein [bacterium]